MTSFTLPKSSLSMEEGKVAHWLVADGDAVTAGQVVVEVETDKSVEELEAPAEGTIRIVAAEGTVVPVEGLLATIGADAPAAAPASDDGAADIDAVLAAPAEKTAKRSLRQAVVAAITASWQQVPHIHIGGELETCGLVATRRTAPAGVTVTDLLVAAVAGALADVPDLNGLNGTPSPSVHLALAVATSDGVVSPVIRHADRLSLEEIAAERSRLVDAARRSASDPRDLGGATSTLSNLGAHPVDFFAPVVSGPQTAMIATGRMADRPVAVEGGLAVRSRMWVNVAIDHRHADGAAGGRFLSALQRRMNP